MKAALARVEEFPGASALCTSTTSWDNEGVGSMRKNLGVKRKLLVVAAAGFAISIPAFANRIDTQGRAWDGVKSHEFAIEDNDFSATDMSTGRKGAHEFVRGMRSGENSGNAEFGLPDVDKVRFHPIIVPEGKLDVDGGKNKSATAVPEPGVLGLLNVGLIGVLSMGTFFRRQRS
jgi:hypothetical protein